MIKSLVELLLTEEDFTPKYTLYCDMDGVLTNFEARFLEMLAKEGKKYYTKVELENITRPKHFEARFGKEELAKFVEQYGEDFWTGMPWMSNGKQLWDSIAPYQPKILSSPFDNNSSRLGKRMWVRQNLSPSPSEIIFRKSEEKQEFSNSTSILIDDKPSNILEWRAKGGIALECKDGEVHSIIEQLKKYYV